MFRFRVLVDGFVRGGFSEQTGMKRKTAEASYREGGMNDTPQKSAGLTTYDNITLKRGQLIGSTQGGDDDFVDWAEQVMDVAAAGNATNYRKDVTTQQYAATNTIARTWAIYDCWVSDYEPMSGQNANTSENSFETIVLTNEGWEKTQ